MKTTGHVHDRIESSEADYRPQSRRGDSVVRRHRLRNLLVNSAAWHRPDQRYEREVDFTHCVHYSLDEHASVARRGFPRMRPHKYPRLKEKMIFFIQCATCVGMYQVAIWL